jgi:hypothetical protein
MKYPDQINSKQMHHIFSRNFWKEEMEMVGTKHGISFWGEENILKLDNSDSYIF